MSKWNVYVTRLLPKPAMDLLKENCNVEVNPEDRVLTRQELLQNVRGTDAIISLLTDIIDSEVMDAAKGVKIIANYAVGFNNINIKSATARGIYITNTPEVLTDATAELAWAILLCTARRVVEADNYLRGGKFKGWGPQLLLGHSVKGKTLGIIGAGRIGQVFAKMSKGFEMKILYYDNKPNLEFEKETAATFVNLDQLLANSDYVSLHVPLTSSTQHLIGSRELKIMKNTAILINTSRGPVVDEKALVEALINNEIWGAGLDVFENEPALAPGLADLNNVVILPHVASATFEARTNMGLVAVKNILAVMENKKPPNCLNPEVFQK
ncbi:MAG: D-glycerate dehydrogenase [Desulfitibacter sp. BRH_c19]|nr:MAG: D-glycerate dehydrogenase [Desulfitibacter sp. BRH_c19]